MSGKPSVQSSAVRAVVPLEDRVGRLRGGVDEQLGVRRAARRALEPELAGGAADRRRAGPSIRPLRRGQRLADRQPAAGVGDDDVGERAADVAGHLEGPSRSHRTLRQCHALQRPTSASSAAKSSSAAPGRRSLPSAPRRPSPSPGELATGAEVDAAVDRGQVQSGELPPGRSRRRARRARRRRSAEPTPCGADRHAASPSRRPRSPPPAARPERPCGRSRSAVRSRTAIRAGAQPSRLPLKEPPW